MGIFDIFSTSDQQQAANDIASGYTRGYGQLSQLFGQGQQDLSTNYGAGSNAVNTATGNANSALATNYAAALQPLMQQQGVNTAGETQLANLLGLNGAAGSASAQNTLENLPGYQFALNQGSQNVLRNQAATGQLASGATLNALQQQGQGLASQNYNNYVSQLMPFLSASNTGASNIAGVNQNLGNATSQNFMNQGAQLNSNATNLGNQLNANLMTQGNAAYGTQAGIANAQAQADLAGLTQSGNILGAGLGAAGALAMFSDERVKDDVEKVGELYDGTNVYRYRYKGDRRHQIGLLAQEVEDRTPSAVVQNLDGTPYKGVNYKEATNYAAELGRMLEAA